ncbi:hypothetical protein H312_01876 [Anncaliia algerae PRA339]|uniref:Trm112p-like protein n=1 Tax=Anncaliia algerae PRA339 TaxID=1288291 RepID=A0A059F089_9MICR|nr:hypothetical protein H312_01876 [Anncaliia algerae PRA339]
MKPFLLQILRCNNCKKHSSLKLFPKKINKTEYEIDKLKLMPSKELIEELNETFQKFEGYVVPHSEIDSINEESLSLIKLLFCNEVEEGELKCRECDEVYFINEGIPSFIKNK